MERLHEKLGTVIPFLALSSFKQVSGKTYMQKLFSTRGELRKKRHKAITEEKIPHGYSLLLLTVH